MSSRQDPDNPEQDAKVAEALRREREDIGEVLRYLRIAQASGPEPCDSCERLLSEYVVIVLRTRAVIEERREANGAGLIDDIGFLDLDARLDRVIAERQRAFDAYAGHRRERHR